MTVKQRDIMYIVVIECQNIQADKQQLHGLLQPTIAILDDIKRRGITEIYSLGDNIGVGPNPSQVLDLLGENGVRMINGNSEEYSTIGIEPFISYFSPQKIESQEWTLS